MPTITYVEGVKVYTASIGVNADTEAKFSEINPLLLPNHLYFCSDKNYLKIGTGAKWSDTDVFISKGGGGSGDGSGAQVYRYVADIAARNAIAEADRNNIIVVFDASADPSVTLGMAGYVWEPQGTSDETTEAGRWVKLFERESLDVDTSNFFDKTTDTADDIADGTTKRAMLLTEAAVLEKLSVEALCTSDSAVVINGVDAEGAAALVTDTLPAA